ncbi:glycosyltransferase [Pelagibacterales bacterium SAG-MED13]|nr:glycosyltransferase [Pelagibacterales bacterium SAG-MED13]
MKNTHENITVQIVLYEENFELIKKCLINLEGIKTVIIDNGNNLELKRKILNRFKIEEYILSKKNLGFSRGHNLASKYVKTKYILILNADCFINKESIEKLIKTIELYDNCGLVAPTTYDKNNNLTYCSGIFPEKGFKGDPLILEGDTCVKTVLGSSMLIKKNLFQEIKGFDENFFLFFSDDELCKRIYSKKFSIIQSFSSTAIHIHGITKVKNIFKKIYLREFHYTFDEMFYYHKLNTNNIILQKYRSKKINYLIKSIKNLIIFRFKKFIFYYARFLAILKFNRLIK